MEKVYPPTSLETAACLWEAVLEMESKGDARGRRIAAARERLGSVHLRLIVIGWTDAVDEEWSKVREEWWDRPFDWDFIPEWIERNVDWFTHEPSINRGAR